jgi:hypothetical protein
LLKRFSFWFTLTAVAISVLHYLGFDKHDLLLLNISLPAWVIEYFVDIHTVSSFFVYAVTILFWFAFGLLIDWSLRRKSQVR